MPPAPASPVHASTVNLDAILSPSTVAIVGASQDPTRIGGRPIRYTRDAGFAGALYPINPNRPEIQGLKAYPSLGEIPSGLDCVVIAVPPDLAEPALEEAARKGARGAIIFTANYAESGPDGVARQERLVAIAKRTGIRLLGPNCLGVFNATTGHAPTFGSFLEGGMLPPGPVGIVSQSGAYASYLYVLARARNLAASRWIATGNEADVSVADCIAHLAGDDGVKVIAAYVEGVKNGPAFLEALAMARAAGKPVVLVKVGRTAKGAEAALSHTASLAGDDAVFDALVRQMGAYRARTSEELIDVVEGLALRGPLRGNRLGIVTISGGAGVLMADAASDSGLEVPAMPHATAARLKAENPLGSYANPLDVTAQAFNDLGLVGRGMRAIVEDGGMDAIAGFFMTWVASPSMGARMQTEISGALEGYGDRTVALAVTAPKEILDAYRAKGILVNEDPSRVVATLGAMAEIGRRLKSEGQPAIDPTMPLLEGTERDEAAAKALLAAAGLPLLREIRCTTADETRAAFGRLGGPVVVKLLSPDVAHKSDIGGVLLNIATSDAAADAFETIRMRLSARLPKARFNGVLVSPMAGKGVELIIAARMDPVFGATVMVGLGGVLVEVLKDVAFRAAPVSPQEARAMIDSLKGRALLDGYRGAPPADINAAAETLARLSQLAARNAGRFETIEINPLLVRETDAVMLDALVTFGEAAR